MMKPILFALALTMGNLLQAQWVSIPDTAFGNWLETSYPGCALASFMDTTCPGIVNAPFVSIFQSNIQDLTGIQYFDNATSLGSSNSQVSFIPAFPPNLQTIGLSNNQLDSLPPLPSTLTNLAVSGNNLQELPDLPAGLTMLSAADNQLSALPNLPNGLRNILLEQNQLTALPQLPDSLQILSIGRNNLTQLPQLPSELKQLTAYINQLTSLPSLPSGIWGIQVAQNQISSLPTVLPDSLQMLDCSDNPLISLPPLPQKLRDLFLDETGVSILPPLPATLSRLDFSDTDVSALPALPNELRSMRMSRTLVTSLPLLPDSLGFLSAGNCLIASVNSFPENLLQIELDSNNIACFPPFPANLWGIALEGNPFTCLPNYVGAMSQDLLNVPLCANNDPVNNPSGCLGTAGIYGQLFQDVDQNCLLSSGDQMLANIPVKRFDLFGNLLETTFSQANGLFHFPVDSGNFRIRIDTAGQPYTISCTVPGDEITVALNNSNPTVVELDFPLENAIGFDLQALGIVPRGIIFPGQPFSLEVYAGLVSSFLQFLPDSTLNGQVQVIVQGPVAYTNPLAGSLSPIISGDTFTYAIADFSNVDWLDDFGLAFTTDTSATIGDSICIEVQVTPTAGDANPINNERQFCFAVGNSFDPNDKLVFPNQVLPGYDDELLYTIRFQNTGTAPAFNIVLRDTLPLELDATSFQFIASSHPCQVSVQENRLSALFSNIQLPDSLSDPKGSQGFLQFRIQPVPGLPLGTLINNRAGIYFDYNAPIITEFAVTTYSSQVATVEPTLTNKEILLFPNPTTGMVQLVFTDRAPQKAFTVEIYNGFGQMVNAKTYQAGQKAEFDLSKESPGVYYLRLKGQIAFAKKLILNR